MSSPATAKKKIEWPLEVRQYVQKCFFPENAIPSVTREELEARLKRIITDATDNNNLYTANWAQMPLPQQMIVQERNAAMLSTPVNPWNSSPVNGYRAPQNVSLTPSSPPQKRKSSELASASNGSVTPPWRQSSNKPSFADRVTAPLKSEKRQKLDVQQKLASKFDLEKRQRRFERDAPMTGPPRELSPSKIDASGPVIGRSQKLEKNYFRLTAPPNPETVRPLPILKQTLELLKKKWRKENNYTYICDQFKSLRQDLTVQHIKNDFTVNVYEIHARIALEKGDLGEYNQCQTQLRALYRQKLGGHPTEFLAYRILYFIHTCNRSDMNDVLADLTPADKTDGAVKHALDVRSALALGNYHRFFQLYLATPNMGAYLMDMFVGRERLAALSRICKAYKPDVKIRFVTEELGFESDEQSARFILEYASEEILQEREDGGVKLLTGKAGNLFEAARANAFKLIDLKGQI
ncbi:putative sac3 ganp domain protein [Phaeomoniella chlamydospora]|uniref:Putative sac3 ganp domain protein n=1 Tax=Phaeomoniella chlamydospora TaxID=158046 RepID=A0A0G2EGG6_PHACM|nr:putative sac3 ganp domain protein [Phaeomoniella chlamydospora]